MKKRDREYVFGLLGAVITAIFGALVGKYGMNLSQGFPMIISLVVFCYVMTVTYIQIAMTEIKNTIELEVRSDQLRKKINKG